tara:strand:+ start:1010 stop:1276 length:267 start_codon:yes stop_codon:yes gene_type:complete
MDAHIKVAELLIANGADLNSKSRSVSMTSLHAAACDNQKEITALLIVKGADINTKDSNGKTPLNYAEEEKTRTWLHSSANTAARRVKN